MVTRAGSADPRAARRPIRRGEEGYNLVMLIVGIAVMNILVAIALPLVSYTIRRDREEETIFRGLQYAEGIRVFRQRFGRYPATLDELVKEEPRSIRQLWTEPLSDEGEFGLVVEAPQQTPGQAPGQAPAPGQAVAAPTPIGQPVTIPAGPGGGNQSGGFGVGGAARVNLLKLPRAKGDDEKQKTLTSGPMAIHGVYLDRQGDSLRKFMGQDKYEQWVFTAELIMPPVTAPGRPLPRVRDDWIGKSFPDGLSPSINSPTGPDGKPLQPGTGPGGKGGKGATPADKDKGEKGDHEDDDGAIDDNPSDLDRDAPSEFPEDFPQDEPRDEPQAHRPHVPPPEAFPEPPGLDSDEEPPVEDPRAEDPGADDTGADDTGADDTGADDTGADESPQ